MILEINVSFGEKRALFQSVAESHNSIRGGLGVECTRVGVGGEAPNWETMLILAPN